MFADLICGELLPPEGVSGICRILTQHFKTRLRRKFNDLHGLGLISSSGLFYDAFADKVKPSIEIKGKKKKGETVDFVLTFNFTVVYFGVASCSCTQAPSSFSGEDGCIRCALQLITLFH